MKKTCVIKGCLDPSKSREMCARHMQKYVLGCWDKRNNIKRTVSCKVPACPEHHYARGYCRDHYGNFRRTGNPKGVLATLKKCHMEECMTITKTFFCSAHQVKGKRLLELKLPLRNISLNAGQYNRSWKGGVSEYPNSWQMRKNRTIKFQKCGGLCACGQRARMIHHKDENKMNHALENLVPLCQKCHAAVHTGTHRSTSKYKRLYGMTLHELAAKYGGSTGYWFDMHKKDKLKKFLDVKK